MDSKFYVSLEAEKLLIEKGCPIEKNMPIYNKYGDVIGCYQADRLTKAEAIDWLESKGIVVWVEPAFIDEWLYFMNSEQHYEDNAESILGTFTTRLEAEEAAIINACKLLKNGN